MSCSKIHNRLPGKICRVECALPCDLFQEIGAFAESFANRALRGTFWEDFTNPYQPLLSATIHSLSKFVDNNNAIGGVEWWIRRKRVDEGMQLHFDKDESLFRTDGVFSHPLFASILYLGNRGGPTVVCGTRKDEDYYSAVQANVFLIFPGMLKHGVMPADPLFVGEMRTTLLLNWWKEKPLGPECQLLTEE